MIRTATQSDLPAIVAIYNSTISSRIATADTEEVSVADKQDWFSSHSSKRPILVYQEQDQVKAWVSFESFYGRPAYHLTAEFSIYIHQDKRGSGLGSKLVNHCISLCPELGLQNLVGYVFSHNKSSLALLEKFGFEKWGELPQVAEMDNQLYSLTIMGIKLSEGRHQTCNLL